MHARCCAAWHCEDCSRRRSPPLGHGGGAAFCAVLQVPVLCELVRYVPTQKTRHGCTSARPLSSSRRHCPRRRRARVGATAGLQCDRGRVEWPLDCGLGSDQGSPTDDVRCRASCFSPEQRCARARARALGTQKARTGTQPRNLPSRRHSRVERRQANRDDLRCGAFPWT